MMWRWLAGVLLFAAFGASTAEATSITLTDPEATFSAAMAAGEECVNVKTGLTGPIYVNCTNNSFLNINEGTAFGLGGTAFSQAFDAWNASNPANSRWTLKDGGLLPGGSLEVFKFRTFVNRTGTIGGVDVRASWEYDGTDKSDFYWTQGLYDNYQKDGTINSLRFEMDVKPQADCDNSDLSKKCPPLYPLQFADRRFEDMPQAPWPNGYFEGFAYLSMADFDKRQLTVYEGFDYGFSLSADPKQVPEPASLPLLFIALAGLNFFKAHKRAIASETRGR